MPAIRSLLFPRLRTLPAILSSLATLAVLLAAGVAVPAYGQSVSGSVTTGNFPEAVAVNPVTNKVYVANQNSNTVTVIDGATNTTATVNVGQYPSAVAVNPVTNKVYVANRTSNTVTVIDGATNAPTTVYVGTSPEAVAVNPVTDKVYVANYGSSPGTVTVIDGATNTTTTVNAGTHPKAVAVNPVTDQIYVANNGNSTVTVIDGATNATATVTVSANPIALAVNPVTNKVYVADDVGSNGAVSVIDGATDTVTNTLIVPQGPSAVAVNPVTDKAYVSSFNSTTLTVIDGANSATSSINVGSEAKAVAVNSATDQVFVSSHLNNNVSVIDGATGTVTSTLSVGQYPAAVAVNPVTDQAYVANTGSIAFGVTGTTVSVIDGATNSTSSINVGNFSTAVAMNPATNKIYVANYGSNSVTVIDEATGLTTTVPVGSYPDAVAVDAATDKIYVANAGTSGNPSTVTVIDGATNTTSNVPAGQDPYDVAVNPVTNTIYVANESSNTVTVIDGATNTTSTVTVGTNPRAVAVNPVTNTVYVANYNSDTVSVIDGATNAVTATVPVGHTPVGLAVDPAADKIYTANYGGNNVTVIDGATNTATSVSVGTGPVAVALNPVTDKVYVANNGSGNVSVINGATNAVSATVPVGANPRALSVNPITNKIYVANNGSSPGTVTVIDGATNSTRSIAAGTKPYVVAADPVSGKAYVVNNGGNPGTVTVIDAEGIQPVPITMTANGVSDSLTTGTANHVFQTMNTKPSFTVQATSAYGASSPYSGVTATDPPPTSLYYSVDGGPWSQAPATTTAGGNPAKFSIALGSQSLGFHTLYYYVGYGNAGGQNSSGYGTGNSPEISNLQAYHFQVDPLTTTTAVVADVNPQNVGSSVTFTATITPATTTSTLTGTVQFYDGSTALGSPVTVQNSGGVYQATYSTSSLTEGTHTIKAVYSGDTNDLGSTGSMTEQIAGAAAAIATSSGGGQSAPIGTPFTNPIVVTVTDSGGIPVPGATVSFSGTGLSFSPATVSTNSSGQASTTATPTQSGSLSGTATVSSYKTTFSETGTKFTPTVTVQPASAVYGAATATLSATVAYTGSTAPTGALTFTVNGGSAVTATCTGSSSPLTCTASYPTASLSVSGSPYTVVANLAADTNYQAATGTGALTITQATPTIQWTAPAAIPYGTALSGTQLNATATYNGSPVAGTFAYTPAAGTVLSAGTHTLSVTFTPTNTADYATPAAATTSITVTQAVPTIQWATPAAIPYGTALSGTQLNATATYNGSPVAGTFAYTPAAGTVLSAGTHTLSVTFTPTNTTDYATPAPATTSITVIQATPILQWPAPAAIPYGTALGATQLDATASNNGSPVAGTFAYTPAAGTVLGAGTHTLSVTFTPTDATDYTTAMASVTVTVTKAASAVALTSSTSNANLNANVTFTATVTSQVSGTPTGGVQFLDGSTVLGTGPLNSNGVATYSTTSLTAGLHQITAVYQGDTNFSGSTSAALAQIVTAPAFSLSSSATNLTLRGGQTGKLTISMTPVGGFKGSVQFTCVGLPKGAKCSFSPTPLTADGSNTPQNSTLTITTQGPNTGTVAMAQPGKPDGILMAGIYWLPALFLGGFLFWQRRKVTARYRVLLILLLASATLSGAVGCGFPLPQAYTGTTAVIVQGTSGSSSQQVTIQLKITQ